MSNLQCDSTIAISPLPVYRTHVLPQSGLPRILVCDSLSADLSPSVTTTFSFIYPSVYDGDMTLDPVQVRVLGSLIEKEIITPEGYPLSLNALINACNQRSSRDPVVELTDDEVRQALHALEEQDLITTVHEARVPKYEHRIRTVLNFRRDETAVLCLLMLRGPQTPGELRGRSERLYSFDDISSVQSTLDRLASREAATELTAHPSATGPLVAILPRQPGSRESRYTHLLSGTPAISEPAPSSSLLCPPSLAERVTELESALNHLSETLATLQARVHALESSS
jgi:uncharacterized protein YceH (UPF0502 family)